MALPTTSNASLWRLSSRFTHSHSSSHSVPARCAPTVISLQSRHDFHSSLPLHSDSFFNLAGLSTSRECRYLAKEKGIPRTEFSPHLELIRSSEVETQQGALGARKLLATKDASLTDAIAGVQSSDGKRKVTVSDPAVERLQADIRQRDEILRDTRLALDRLVFMYRKRSKEARILAGVIILLTAGIIFSDELLELRLSILRKWGARGAEKREKAARRARQDRGPERTKATMAQPSAGFWATESETESAAAATQRPFNLSNFFWAS